MIYIVSNRVNNIDFEYADLMQCTSIEHFKSWVEGKKVLGFDTEAEGSFDFVNKMLSIQIGDEVNQFFFDLHYMSGDERMAIQHILADETIIKIFHNAKYDIKSLWFTGFRKLKSFYCSMLAEVIDAGGLDKPDGWYSLESIIYRLFGATTDKYLRNRFTIDNIIHYKSILYSCGDVKYLIPIRERQIRDLKVQLLASDDCQDKYTVLGLENRVQFAYAEMEYVGVKPSIERLDEVQKHVDEEVLKCIERLNNIAISDPILKKKYKVTQNLFGSELDINWKSSKQKLEVLRLVFSKIPNTRKETLQKYKDKHIIVEQLIEFSKWNSLRDKFVTKIKQHINPVTGRVHTNFWQMVSTGRVSSSNPNMQQIPSRGKTAEKIRACFVEDEGYDWVGSDYSGCELRLIAELTQDPVWLSIFRKGENLHSVLCSKTFNIPMEEVKEYSTLNPDLTWRDIQKTIDFGIPYGMSVFKLATVLQQPVAAAKKVMNMFFSMCPKVKEFLEQISDFAVRNLFMRTAKPYGRVRKFDGWTDEDEDWKIRTRKGEISRAAKNFPFQGGNADLIKLATLEVYETKPPYVKLLLQIHDELQTRCLSIHSKEWSLDMKRIMLEAGKVIVKSIPMESDPSISPHWVK